MAVKQQNRAKSVAEILKYKPKALPFTGAWFDSFGTPELSGCWLIWGNSGNGKTRFTLQLCKYLANFGRVAYNSLEEGLSLSFQSAIKAVGMRDVTRRFVLLDKEPIDELRARLSGQKSPDVVVIDSIQYSGLSKDTAKALVDEFPRKLFIFVSHADGKNPAGRPASAIRFHAGVKLWVEGYRIPAPVSRYKDGECTPFTIWTEGAERYWVKITD
ncbi:MAG: ATP-dependent serine protease [Prevotellaceae bacterium]|jgi:hypothetical protein|nr:ATP-dependent serine protease [Prevotellaceae bacterium]